MTVTLTYIEGVCISSIELDEFSEECIRERYVDEDEFVGDISSEEAVTITNINSQTIVTVFNTDGEAFFIIGDELLFKHKDIEILTTVRNYSDCIGLTLKHKATGKYIGSEGLEKNSNLAIYLEVYSLSEHDLEFYFNHFRDEGADTDYLEKYTADEFQLAVIEAL